MEVPQYGLELNSDTFMTFAFNTHPLAYLDAGLADLPFSDLWLIVSQPNLQEWCDGRTWNQAVQTSVKVMRDKIPAPNRADMGDAVGNALDRLLAR